MSFKKGYKYIKKNNVTDTTHTYTYMNSHTYVMLFTNIYLVFVRKIRDNRQKNKRQREKKRVNFR